MHRSNDYSRAFAYRRLGLMFLAIALTAVCYISSNQVHLQAVLLCIQPFLILDLLR